MQSTNRYVGIDYIPLTVMQSALELYGTYSELECKYDCYVCTNMSNVLIDDKLYRAVKFYDKNKHILFKLKFL